MEIKNKLVLISGASSGIGEACARIYAKNGANLLLTARRTEKLENLKNELVDKYGIKAEIFTFDVRNREAVEKFGKNLEEKKLTPNIFINNAGLAKGAQPIDEGNIDDWDAMIDTNIKGFLYMARAVIPMMVKKNSGHIVNLGSIAGHQVYPAGNVYSATKFAVRALSQAMNIDLVKTNIRVGTIEPGAVETEFSEVRFNGDKTKVNNVYKGFKPLTGEDIAEIIYFMTILPEHINIQNLLVTPTAQRSVNFVRRD